MLIYTQKEFVLFVSCVCVLLLSFCFVVGFIFCSFFVFVLLVFGGGVFSYLFFACMNEWMFNDTPALVFCCLLFVCFV